MSAFLKISTCQQRDLPRLFEYWKHVGQGIPYFFPVSVQAWQTCLLADELAGEKLFKRLETYLATENGQILGFVQYGQPNFAWDSGGQKHDKPRIGVIRQLYFEEGRNDVGRALLAKADEFLARFDQNHAFYHILGMSCTAHHGKLHSSQPHVDRLLRERGFQIEHENVYYVLDIQLAAPAQNDRVQFRITHESGEPAFEIRWEGKLVGGAKLCYLDTPTGGHTRDVAYLTRLWVDEQHRGRGIGTELLKQLVQFLSSRRYRYLHTDTPDGNLRAQRLYEKLGFQQEGYTRSYIRGSRTRL